MTTTTTDMLLEAADLLPGERTRIPCVFCGGTDKTLSVSRMDDGAVVWNCYRAGCGVKGGANGGRLIRIRQQPRKQEFTPFEGELVELPVEVAEFLWGKVRFSDAHLRTSRARWAPEEKRVAFPIFGPMGTRRGWMLRSYDPRAWNKARTHMDCGEPHMSWYASRPTGVLLVVEDIPSAVRAAQYVDALALCGTGCGPDYVQEIAAHKRRVVWALDADATHNAVKLARANQLLFEDSGVLVLTRDIKDMEENELKDLLGVLT